MENEEVFDPRILMDYLKDSGNYQKEDNDFMVQSLVEKVLHDKDIEQEMFEATNQTLNEERMKIDKMGAIGFNRDASFGLYETLTKLQGKLKIPT